MAASHPTEDDRLQAQYDGIPVPCYTWRAEHGEFVLERANRAAFEMSRGEIGDLLGRRARELYAGQPQIVAELERCLHDRRTLRREMDHRLASTGAQRRLDVSYVYVPPDRVMVHADDVTERRAQERRLRESEERFRAVIGTLESGVLTVDEAGRTVDANPAACAILGLSKERLLADPGWWRTLQEALDVAEPLARFGGDEFAVLCELQDERDAAALPAFADRIADTIRASGLAPERIALELTETALIEGGEPAIGGLDSLFALGVKLYLDDFGTGYSSLTRLAKLPLTGIKLDRGFVARATGERDRRIIKAALSMGRAADLGVVAEGVETEDQLAMLRGCGCDRMQGFLLGRPAAPEQAAAGLT
jgi:EAL domain-containing protein (putative c-di-GMP-specific phosphodiesterase class I)